MTKIQTPRDILMAEVQQVAIRHRVTILEIMSHAKASRVVAARFEAYHVIFKRLKSLSATARFFGRDHSSIAYGVGRHLENIGQLEGWMVDMARRKREARVEHHRRAA